MTVICAYTILLCFLCYMRSSNKIYKLIYCSIFAWRNTWWWILLKNISFLLKLKVRSKQNRIGMWMWTCTCTLCPFTIRERAVLVQQQPKSMSVSMHTSTIRENDRKERHKSVVHRAISVCLPIVMKSRDTLFIKWKLLHTKYVNCIINFIQRKFHL